MFQRALRNVILRGKMTGSLDRIRFGVSKFATIATKKTLEVWTRSVTKGTRRRIIVPRVVLIIDVRGITKDVTLLNDLIKCETSTFQYSCVPSQWIYVFVNRYNTKNKTTQFAEFFQYSFVLCRNWWHLHAPKEQFSSSIETFSRKTISGCVFINLSPIGICAVDNNIWISNW